MIPLLKIFIAYVCCWSYLEYKRTHNRRWTNVKIKNSKEKVSQHHHQLEQQEQKIALANVKLPELKGEYELGQKISLVS